MSEAVDIFTRTELLLTKAAIRHGGFAKAFLVGFGRGGHVRNRTALMQVL